LAGGTPAKGPLVQLLARHPGERRRRPHRRHREPARAAEQARRWFTALAAGGLVSDPPLPDPAGAPLGDAVSCGCRYPCHSRWRGHLPV